MMDTLVTLSTAPLEHPAMDYDFLRQEGIRHLERMAGQVWTDFNTHDPGITILEQVCYALTDLAHRINYSIPDLLAQDDKATDESFYTPARIFTTHPVTLDDLRKVAIDVDGVKNAWIEKADAEYPVYYVSAPSTLNAGVSTPTFTLTPPTPSTPPIPIKGLYRVLIERSDFYRWGDSTDATEQSTRKGDPTASSANTIRKAVQERLHANRGLCEDFADFVMLEPEDIRVAARIEIEAVDDIETLLITIYQHLAEYISPTIPFYSLSEMLNLGKSVDEIFDGPLLKHGFIDTETLRQTQRRSALRTSDVIRVIMAIPGVRAVRTIRLGIGVGDNWEDWSLKLNPQGSAPRFDPSRSMISLERNGLKVDLNLHEKYAQQMRAAAAAAHISAADDRDLYAPQGRGRQVGQYYSIQHQFPLTYGLGAGGLPDSASPERKAQALQLQAYLMFFDQLLANYFAQLAHTRDLFSFSDAAVQTYFSQLIDDPTLNLEALYQDAAKSGNQSLKDRVDTISRFDAMTVDRRNRFLNHLLARFAEQFTDYSLFLYAPAASSTTEPESSQSLSEESQGRLIDAKRQFLQHYPEVSSARGTGFNILQPWSDSNCSGLEKRILRKLGLGTADARFYMIEHILLRPMMNDDQQGLTLMAAPASKDPYSLQVSFVFLKDLSRFQTASEAEKAAEAEKRFAPFQQFVERTVRAETPAHLVVTIHWFDAAEMAAFAEAYQHWVDTRAAYSIALSAAKA